MVTSTLTTLAALMLAGATADPLPTAPMPQVAKVSTIYKLRNVAAADVAFALNTHFKSVVVTAEPVSNSLLVSAEPGLQQQVLKLLADLDRAAPQFVVSIIIIKAKAGFAEEIGIAEQKNDGPEYSWVLSPREVRMFSGCIRQAKKDGGLDILSRPMLQVAENQNGFIQIGDGTAPFKAAVTPRLMPDGRILMRVGVQAGDTAAAKAHHESLTSTVADGGTLMVRCQLKGESSEILYVLTVHVVK